MTDIVQRLRLIDPNQVLLMEPPHDTRYVHAGLICHEAATEIERLRDEVLAEREACAQIVDANAAACANNSMLQDVLRGNAAAIRARGEKQ